MIVIYGIKEQLNPIKAALSETIHACLMHCLGIPEDKRAQRFIPMDKADFFYPGGRTDAYTVIEINLMAGRQQDTLKRLIKHLFQQIEAQHGIRPVDLEIIIKEQPAHCWGFRGMTGDEVRDLSYSVNV